MLDGLAYAVHLLAQRDNPLWLQAIRIPLDQLQYAVHAGQRVVDLMCDPGGHLAETGQAAGAIQIAGTADVTQLPFFVTTCDYTLLGEELYAASAYLSREPVLLGSIKAQDTAKAILMVIMASGIILLAFNTDIIVRLLETH